MMDLENAVAFSQVLRWYNLRYALARRKTKVQNLPPATKLRNAGILVIPAFFRIISLSDLVVNSRSKSMYSRLLLLMGVFFLVLRRRHTRALFKESTEIQRVFITDDVGNLGDVFVAALQIAFGGGNA